MRRFYAAIALISAAVLALELVLMRILAISSWHHFSYMVISVALLGFGTGGVLLTLFQRWLRPRWRAAFWLLCLGFAAAVPASHVAAARIPLNVLELLWDPWQSLYLLATYLVLFVPFLLGGTAIGLALTVAAARANRAYFFNLVGSGVGAAAAVLLMYGHPPVRLLLVVSAVAAAAAFVFCLDRPWRAAASLVVAGSVFLIFAVVRPLEQPVSEFKSLPYYRALPDAALEATRYGPLGRLDLVSADSIHIAPGLSSEFAGTLPAQKVLLTDADSPSAVSTIRTPEDAAWFDYATSALPYHLLTRPAVCVIGAGPGGDLLQAVHGGAAHVTAVELNPQVIDVVRAADPALDALYRRPDVVLRLAEARFFLESTDRQFDLIQISLLDSFTAASAGLYSLSESHLYTVEAVEAAMARLRPGGTLAITRWLRVPPRDNPRMLATVVEAMRRHPGRPPVERIIMIRGMLTATLLAGRDPFTADQRRLARQFCSDRAFDLVYLCDMADDEANRHHVLPPPLDQVHVLARDLVEGDTRRAIREYPYNIAPAIDDRPFFFDFFRWRSLPDLARTYGRQWRPFAEWGYLVLIASLAQTAAVAAVLLLLPGWLLKRRGAAARTTPRAVFLYFMSLGFAFIFLEMGFITRLTLLLGNPIYATAVVLASMLVFSGLGSLAGERRFGSPRQAVRRAVIGIALCAAAALLLLNFAFPHLVALPLAGRVLVAVLLSGSVAFFMGLPFPSGLRMVDGAAPRLVPWAWAVNGFASVVGAVGGTALAMSVGFTALAVVSLGLYVFAALLAARLAGPPAAGPTSPLASPAKPDTIPHAGSN